MRASMKEMKNERYLVPYIFTLFIKDMHALCKYFSSEKKKLEHLEKSSEQCAIKAEYLFNVISSDILRSAPLFPRLQCYCYNSELTAFGRRLSLNRTP